MEMTLSLEEVKGLTYGKGCVIESRKKIIAMYTGEDHDGRITFITDNGALCRYKSGTYGKTWKVVEII